MPTQRRPRIPDPCRLLNHLVLEPGYTPKVRFPLQKTMKTKLLGYIPVVGPEIPKTLFFDKFTGSGIAIRFLTEEEEEEKEMK